LPARGRRIADPLHARALALHVFEGIDDFRGGEISFRFKPVAGRIDQGAGILFNLKPNGDYLLVRANTLENNLVLFQLFSEGAAVNTATRAVPKIPGTARRMSGYEAMIEEVRFAEDSPLEEAGFEPSVPGSAIQVSRGAHLDSAGFPVNGKSRREREPTPRRCRAPSA
jgi:hypothetical protein